MNNSKENILVTAALPYANGSIHLGHLVEYIQTDIWVRFQKLNGNRTYFFCADDTHGTPIMIAARQRGIKPEKLIEEVQKEHIHDLTSFGVEFTNYYSTNSSENEKLSQGIFLNLKKDGHIVQKEVKQAFCEHDNIFLPDRFIKGQCPKCGAKEQYGDSCEVCGSTYSSTDLVEPHCSICGNPPVEKTSVHYFFKLRDFEKELRDWYREKGHVSEGVAKKMSEWFDTGLRDWDISRDGPYFGFKIPGEDSKYFYVWLDAPVGYMASSLNFFQKNNQLEEHNKFWSNDPNYKIYHFIGKDIMYFHTLFWPAQLMGAGYKTPDGIFIHGFLTINGEKMSKSKGTFILASTYLKYLDPNYLRFYYASKLSDSMDDLDLNFEDFTHRINSDLVGNFINILSRSAGSIAKKLDYKLSALSEEGRMVLSQLLDRKELILESYVQRNYARVVREISALGDIVNRYLNDAEPWKIVNGDPEKAREVITTAINAAKILTTYYKAIIPQIAAKIEDMLQIPELNFNNLDEFLENREIKPYEHLIQRVEKKSIDKMVQDSLQSINLQKKEDQGAEDAKEEIRQINIDDLVKVELRVGLIEEASEVDGSDKLLQLKVRVSEKDLRNVFAGIKKAYQPEELVQKKCVIVANLKPRKMKFGISEAMLLASGEGDKISLLVPDKEANPGDLLK